MQTKELTGHCDYEYSYDHAIRNRLPHRHSRLKVGDLVRHPSSHGYDVVAPVVGVRWDDGGFCRPPFWNVSIPGRGGDDFSFPLASPGSQHNYAYCPARTFLDWRGGGNCWSNSAKFCVSHRLDYPSRALRWVWCKLIDDEERHVVDGVHFRVRTPYATMSPPVTPPIDEMIPIRSDIFGKVPEIVIHDVSAVIQCTERAARAFRKGK